MAKSTFKKSFGWSTLGDWSQGALPNAVIMPDGERVEFSDEALYDAEGALHRAREGGSMATYAELHPQVRIRRNRYGDEGNRPSGQSVTVWEIMAPKGSRFVIYQFCPVCGGQTGEVDWSERTQTEVPHEDCPK